MTEDFDKNLREYFNSEAAVKPSRDLYEAAIQKVIKRKEGEAVNKNLSFKFSPRKLAIAFSCVFVLSFGVAMAASPDVRNAVSKFVHSVFTVEKQGDEYQIVEKNADDELITYFFNGIVINKSHEGELANKIGFKPFIPDTIGKKSVINKYKTLDITLSCKVNDLFYFYKNKDKVSQCAWDDSALKSMKQYNPIRNLNILYSSDGTVSTDMIGITMSKNPDKFGRKICETISEFHYKGIKCSYVKTINPAYEEFTIPQTGIDPTKKPDGTAEGYYIGFEYNGVYYSVKPLLHNHGLWFPDFEYYEYEEAVKFTKDYIDAFMSQKQ